MTYSDLLAEINENFSWNRKAREISDSKLYLRTFEAVGYNRRPTRPDPKKPKPTRSFGSGNRTPQHFFN